MNVFRGLKNIREKKALLEKEKMVVEQVKACLKTINLENYDLAVTFSEAELTCMAKQVIIEKKPVRQFVIEELCNLREVIHGGMRCLMPQ